MTKTFNLDATEMGVMFEALELLADDKAELALFIEESGDGEEAAEVYYYDEIVARQLMADLRWNIRHALMGGE